MVYLFLETESVRTRWRRRRALALFALDRRVRFSLRENSALVFTGVYLRQAFALCISTVLNRWQMSLGSMLEASERRTRKTLKWGKTMIRKPSRVSLNAS
jgi:hypothetical protein